MSKLEASVNRGQFSNRMRSLSWVAIVAMVFVGVVYTPRHANAQAPAMFTVPFSADEIMTTQGRLGAPQTMTGKIYVGKARLRTDMNVGGRGNMATIINLETKETIILMLDQKMAMNMSAMAGMAGRGMGGPKPPIDTSKPFDPEHPCSVSADMTCAPAGNETVNGRECQKWIITSKSPNGGTTTSTAWVDMRLRFPVKTVGDSFSLELKNIVEGAQPDNLFAIPPDFKVMDPRAMMGGRN